MDERDGDQSKRKVGDFEMRRYEVAIGVGAVTCRDRHQEL